MYKLDLSQIKEFLEEGIKEILSGKSISQAKLLSRYIATQFNKDSSLPWRGNIVIEENNQVVNILNLPDSIFQIFCNRIGNNLLRIDLINGKFNEELQEYFKLIADVFQLPSPEETLFISSAKSNHGGYFITYKIINNDTKEILLNHNLLFTKYLFSGSEVNTQIRKSSILNSIKKMMKSIISKLDDEKLFTIVQDQELSNDGDTIIYDETPRDIKSSLAIHKANNRSIHKLNLKIINDLIIKLQNENPIRTNISQEDLDQVIKVICEYISEQFSANASSSTMGNVIIEEGNQIENIRDLPEILAQLFVKWGKYKKLINGFSSTKLFWENLEKYLINIFENSLKLISDVFFLPSPEETLFISAKAGYGSYSITYKIINNDTKEILLNFVLVPTKSLFSDNKINTELEYESAIKSIKQMLKLLISKLNENIDFNKQYLLFISKSKYAYNQFTIEDLTPADIDYVHNIIVPKKVQDQEFKEDISHLENLDEIHSFLSGLEDLLPEKNQDQEPEGTSNEFSLIKKFKQAIRDKKIDSIMEILSKLREEDKLKNIQVKLINLILNSNNLDIFKAFFNFFTSDSISSASANAVESDNVNLPLDQDNSTLLHLACKKNKIKIVKYLIEMGANISLEDNNNFTPLQYLKKDNLNTFDDHEATNFEEYTRNLLNEENDRQSYILEILNILYKDESLPKEFSAIFLEVFGKTFLSFFAKSNKGTIDEIFHFLAKNAILSDTKTAAATVNKISDPNIIDKHGNTPLHLAVLSRNYHLVEALLKHKNINTLIKDQYGKTAEGYLDVFIKHGDENFKQIFERVYYYNNVKLDSEKLLTAFLKLKTYCESFEIESTANISLYKHQLEALKQMNQFVQENWLAADGASTLLSNNHNYSGFIKMATGLGKTYIFLHLLKILGLKATIVVPTLTLINQISDEIAKILPEVSKGIINNTNAEYDNDITITTYDTLTAHYKHLKDVLDSQIIIFDEAHEGLSEKRSQVVKFFQEKGDRLLLGFTATDEYSQKLKDSLKSVGELLQNKLFSLSIAEGMKNDLLAKVDVVEMSLPEKFDLTIDKLTPGNIDEDQIQSRDNIYRFFAEDHAEELAKIIDHNSNNNDPTLIFVPSIKAAKKLEEELNKKHQKTIAKAIYSTQKNNDLLIAEHKNNEFKFLINVDILTCGYDDPNLIEIFDFYPTKSELSMVQRFGRITRKKISDEVRKKYFQLILSNIKGQKMMTEYLGHEEQLSLQRDDSLADLTNDSFDDEERQDIKSSHTKTYKMWLHETGDWYTQEDPSIFNPSRINEFQELEILENDYFLIASQLNLVRHSDGSHTSINYVRRIPVFDANLDRDELYTDVEDENDEMEQQPINKKRMRNNEDLEKSNKKQEQDNADTLEISENSENVSSLTTENIINIYSEELIESMNEQQQNTDVVEPADTQTKAKKRKFHDADEP